MKHAPLHLVMLVILVIVTAADVLVRLRVVAVERQTQAGLAKTYASLAETKRMLSDMKRQVQPCGLQEPTFIQPNRETLRADSGACATTSPLQSSWAARLSRSPNGCMR